VNDERRDNPKRALASILDEAGMRFNLSPLDSEALQRLFSRDVAPDGQDSTAGTE
jgi:hypothetical protein